MTNELPAVIDAFLRAQLQEHFEFSVCFRANPQKFARLRALRRILPPVTSPCDALAQVGALAAEGGWPAAVLDSSGVQVTGLVDTPLALAGYTGKAAVRVGGI